MIYQTSRDNRARFSLGELGRRTLITLGVNPSTATDKVFDRTIQKVRGFSQKHGFDGWLMINIYPQRATRPSDMHTDLSIPYHRANLKVISVLFQRIPSPKVWCASGDAIEERSYLKNCLRDVVETMSDFEPIYCSL